MRPSKTNNNNNSNNNNSNNTNNSNNNNNNSKNHHEPCHPPGICTNFEMQNRYFYRILQQTDLYPHRTDDETGVLQSP